MVCTKKPLLVLIVESRGFFGSANNASCLDNAFVSLHLRIPPRVLHFSAFITSMNCSYLVRNFVSHTLTGSSGRISFHNLKPGFYILKVHAYNRKLDVATLKILLEVN